MSWNDNNPQWIKDNEYVYWAKAEQMERNMPLCELWSYLDQLCVFESLLYRCVLDFLLSGLSHKGTLFQRIINFPYPKRIFRIILPSDIQCVSQVIHGFHGITMVDII